MGFDVRDVQMTVSEFPTGQDHFQIAPLTPWRSKLELKILSQPFEEIQGSDLRFKLKPLILSINVGPLQDRFGTLLGLFWEEFKTIMITVWDYFWALISFFLPSLTLFSSMSPFAPSPTEEGPKGPPSLRRSWRDGRVAPRSSSLLISQYLNNCRR